MNKEAIRATASIMPVCIYSITLIIAVVIVCVTVLIKSNPVQTVQQNNPPQIQTKQVIHAGAGSTIDITGGEVVIYASEGLGSVTAKGNSVVTVYNKKSHP